MNKIIIIRINFNWYYKDIGMTALDLLRMMEKYEFVRQAVESS